jgi:hypothetical protein
MRRAFGAPVDDDLGDNLGSSSRTPHLVQPIQPLSVGLHEFFARPKMVRVVNAWKTRRIVDGELNTIYGGNVWQAIEGPDGTPFFSGDANQEIRLGVTLSLDW